jgi:hypothetical protein
MALMRERCRPLVWAFEHQTGAQAHSLIICLLTMTPPRSGRSRCRIAQLAVAALVMIGHLA